MATGETIKRVVITADDFGKSSSVNSAIIRAHQDGILTAASLMVNEPGFPEAVNLARQNPNLGVGLHLTLLNGASALDHQHAPDLVNECNRFCDCPVQAGIRYFIQRKIRRQLADEMDAQYEKFRQTGLPLDHVNGHHHLHLHPVVFPLLIERVKKWGIHSARLTRDRFWLNARLASGNWFGRATLALAHGWLASRAKPFFTGLGIKHTSSVFGLLQNAKVDEGFLLRLLPVLPQGDSEIFSHPCLEHFKAEFEALVSPRVKSLVQQLGIRLVRYQDL